MSGDNNNNPDQLIVNADTITYRILERFNRLNELRYGRLQPLIDRLRPDQRNDPRRHEVAVKREMVLLGYSILRIYVVACVTPYSRRSAHLVRNSITLFDRLDNGLQAFETEIHRLEQQLVVLRLAENNRNYKKVLLCGVSLILFIILTIFVNHL